MDQNQCTLPEGTKTCCAKACDKMVCLLAVIAAFVAMFAVDFLYHGMLLRPMYETTAGLWRAESEMQNMWPWCIGLHLAMAVVFTCLYKSFCSQCDGQCYVGKGVKLGFKVGLLMGIGAFGMYMMMPMPMNLALGWLFGEVLCGVVVGAAIGMVYKLKNKQN